MRSFVIALAVCGALLVAGPASALQQGDLALSPEVGMVFFTGDMANLAAGDVGYGATFAYGILDWLAFEAGALFSEHQQAHKKETGEIAFGHVLGDLGVRFNYHTRYVIPYASVLAGVTFIRYKAEWEVGNEKRSEEEHSHGFGGAAIVGVDFFVHDNFTVGLAGRGGYFTSNLEYTNRDVRGETVPAYGYLAGCLRLAIVF